ATIVCRGHEVTYREGNYEHRWKTQNPLQDLKKLFATKSPAEIPGLPRFWGGAVGYWGYDTARFFERLPDHTPDPSGFPTGAFQLTGDLVVLDRFSQMAQVISNIYVPEGKQTPKALKALYDKGARAIERQIAKIEGSYAPP